MHLICKVSSIAERNKSKCALLEPGVVLNGANPVPVVLGMWAHFFVTYSLYPARAWLACLLGGGPFGLFWSLSPVPVFQNDRIHDCVFGIRTDLGLNLELIRAPGKGAFSLQAALSLKRLGTSFGPTRPWKDTKIYVFVAFLSFEYLTVWADFVYLLNSLINFSWRLITIR